MATQCICGNETSAEPSGFKCTVQPCKCGEPGPGRRQRRLAFGVPEFCFAKQYEERRRLNLPLETDIERSVRTRWYSG